MNESARDQRSSSFAISGSPSLLAEVSIRTMQSDIASMASSGGALPQGNSMSVSLGSSEPRTSGVWSKEQSVSTIGVSPGKPSSFFWILVAIGVCVAFLVGYFLIPLLFPQSVPRSGSPPGSFANLGAAMNQKTDTPSFSDFTRHASFFRVPADYVIAFQEDPSVPLNYDRYILRIKDALKKAPKGAGFLEIVPLAYSGSFLPWGEFISRVDITVFDKNFFNAHFLPDFTAFLYKNEKEFFLGYILKLKDQETPPLIQKEVSGIEQSASNLVHFFLASPGDPKGSFHDIQINGQPARTLSFSSPGASISYGWFYKRYLVISTSEQGLKEAILRL